MAGHRWRWGCRRRIISCCLVRWTTKDKRVKDVMTPIERVYSFEASARLNFATMMEIYRSGTSW